MLIIIKLILVGSKILCVIRLILTNGEGDVVVVVLVLVVFADVVTTDNFLSILIKNKSETTDTTEKLMSGIRLRDCQYSPNRIVQAKRRLS